jgi:phosphoserine phosphatase RsbU/P
MSSAAPVTNEAPDRMQCMEVWGGNSEVNKSFEVPGLRVWVYSKPHGQAAAGGDVYYISSCASGRITRLLLADVSGHGPAAADLAVALRDLMRKNVNLIRQGRLVEGMNRQFGRVSTAGEFATALVSTFFQPARKLTLCNAGHPPPLFFQARQNRWSILQAEDPENSGIFGTPLGVHDQAYYPPIELPLEPGDLVLIYSDALSESRDATGGLLGIQGLAALARQLDTSDPSRCVPALLGAVRQSHAGNLDHDDVTVILFQATGTATTLRDNLLAPYRLLRGVADRTALE